MHGIWNGGFVVAGKADATVPGADVSWSATYRAIRANSIAAIGLSLLLLAVLVTSTH